ncbi:MAG: hypothetical protein LH610_07675 [Sphingomonas bacterium]|nr:hypothetical protein [Sphingomonas bacterium]
MNAQGQGNWADRMGSTRRYTMIVIAAICGIFMIGMLAGFSYAIYEDGKLPTKPLAYIVFAAILALAALVGWVLTTLIRSLRHQSMSGFDRRYWKMWAAIVGLSFPIGIGIAVLGLSNQANGMSLVLSNSPIAPVTAILGSLATGILLIAAAVIYHRTIDDHEERAYLWGSTIAYYFLVLAFPLHWLLARGGIVPALTIGVALLLVLLSTIVQAIAWALLKFR